MINNVPSELKALAQWVCSGKDKVPVNPRTGRLASVTDPETWGTFEEAKACGLEHVGFVLTADDPFAIVDLDNPFLRSDKSEIKPEDEDYDVAVARAERHQKIADAFETYSEVSQSGNGLHIVVRSSVPRGVRRDKVELYSSERYMIFTGNVYNNAPICECDELLQQLYNEMSCDRKTSELVQIDSEVPDEEIYNKIANSANAENFLSLWNGEWQQSYGSQSEADFAMLGYLCFYTSDNNQVRRLFRSCELGKRKKAHRDSYLDAALRKIRAETPAQVNFEKLLKNHEAKNNKPNDDESELEPLAELDAGGSECFVENSNDAQGSARRERAGTVCTEGERDGTWDTGDNPLPCATNRRIAFPPGLVGELAHHFYDTALRPVPEIAIAAALAITAGVIGRSFNISDSGLNLYIIVVARTGRGKEGAATAIDNFVHAVRRYLPTVDEFVGPANFASGPALIRALDKQHCFVSVLGEIGLTLQRICDPNALGSSAMLKQALLDLYGKSGFKKILRSSVYSDAEKNTKIVQAPNVTILGDTTPSNFYDALNSANIEEGLVPRFIVFEYAGERVRVNPHPYAPPPDELVKRFAELGGIAMRSERGNLYTPITLTPSAQRLLDNYNERVDEIINNSGNSTADELWNRAHFKALKLAGLLAAAESPTNPVVTEEIANYAIETIDTEVSAMVSKFASGEFGFGDLRQESDVKRAIKDFLRAGKRRRKGYMVPNILLDLDVIPLTYLQRRLRPLSSFANDRRGSTLALSQTLKNMCDAGQLVQLSPIQVRERLNLTVPCYITGENWF